MAMTKDEFRAQVRRLGYTVDEFARLNGVAPSTAYQWGNRYGIPRWVPRVLALEAQQRAAMPPPAPRPAPAPPRKRRGGRSR